MSHGALGYMGVPGMITSARAEVLGITNKECHCVNKMSSRQHIDCMYEWYCVSTKARVH